MGSVGWEAMDHAVEAGVRGVSNVLPPTHAHGAPRSNTQPRAQGVSLVARSASDLRLIIAVHHCRNGAVSLPPKLTR